MAKIVDITDKLDFDSNPKIMIKGKEYEVNSDAETVLKVMGILSEEGESPKAITHIYELIFSEKARNAIKKLNLQFKDLRTVIETAIDLIMDEEDQQGEQ